MNKKIILGIGILIVIVIVIVAVFPQLKKNSGSVISGSATIDTNNIALNEELRFTKFRAEWTCNLINTPEEENIIETLKNLELYTAKYNFNTDFTIKFIITFQLILNR